MRATKSPSSLVLGLAVFSVFFGAGNMIYPLHVGALLSDAWGMSVVGFLFSAVGFPFFAICVIYSFRGNLEPVLRSLGSRFRVPLLLLLCTVWIPLGAGPRCITMTVGSLEMFGLRGPPGLLSVVYSLLVMGLTWRRRQGLTWLGVILMPILLLSLLVLVLRGMWLMGPLPEGAFQGHGSRAFLSGLLEGCHTMDLFAALFFSTAALPLFQRNSLSLFSLPQFIKGGLGALVMLGIVYLGLMILAVNYGGQLQLVPQEKGLAFLASTFLVGPLGWMALGVIVLACLTMSVALTRVYADYIYTYVIGSFAWGSYRVAVVITIASCWVLSLLGFRGMTWILTPLLKGLYPLMLGLLLLAAIRSMWNLQMKRGRL